MTTSFLVAALVLGCIVVVVLCLLGMLVTCATNSSTHECNDQIEYQQQGTVINGTYQKRPLR